MCRRSAPPLIRDSVDSGVPPFKITEPLTPHQHIHPRRQQRATMHRPGSHLASLFLGLLLPTIVAGLVEPSAFGTTPFSDDKVTSPQKVPGKVWLAWFDEGGAGKATHTYDDRNHGSCELNPCTGVNATYMNTFRKDANISVSYTKPLFYWQNKAWADRWASNKTLVPMDEFYVGWMVVGNWFRITVDVQQPGLYTADLYFTCPNGGTVDFTMSDYHTGLTIDQQSAELPKTTYFHDWAVKEEAVTMLLKPGWSVLTLNMTSVGGDPAIHWGNWIWIVFKLKLGM